MADDDWATERPLILMCTELTVIAEEGDVAGTETGVTVDWNAVELDEPTDLVIAPMSDTKIAKLFGIPFDDRDKQGERDESSLPTNDDEDVDAHLMEEAADDVDDAHDDELVHVYDKENPVIEVGKLCPSMAEFRMCFKTYAVKHEFDAKTVWTDKKKFYARCRGFDGSVRPCKWRKRASQPLVVEECWPTKKARVNGCRKKRSVPAETEPERVEVQTQENPAAHEFQTEETHVKVHTEETETAADEFQTEEAHVETEETQPETAADEFQTKEAHVEAHIQTEETAVNIHTEDIFGGLSRVKKTKMMSELVCVVEPKTKSGKAKNRTRRGRKKLN
ncbi:hypothetical protein D1007_27733 [Hordeum vulgare]|nr:hypothetical protein D1007_27733 [Hordeum vulgare]